MTKMFFVASGKIEKWVRQRCHPLFEDLQRRNDTGMSIG